MVDAHTITITRQQANLIRLGLLARMKNLQGREDMQDSYRDSKELCEMLFPIAAMKPLPWTNPTSLAEIEAALDSGRLFIAIGPTISKFWQARRNGKTKRWKRAPERYYIPIKFGFKGYEALDQNYPLQCLRIALNREEAES